MALLYLTSPHPTFPYLTLPYPTLHTHLHTSDHHLPIPCAGLSWSLMRASASTSLEGQGEVRIAATHATCRHASFTLAFHTAGPTASVAADQATHVSSTWGLTPPSSVQPPCVCALWLAETMDVAMPTWATVLPYLVLCMQQAKATLASVYPQVRVRRALCTCAAYLRSLRTAEFHPVVGRAPTHGSDVEERARRCRGAPFSTSCRCSWASIRTRCTAPWHSC